MDSDRGGTVISDGAVANTVIGNEERCEQKIGVEHALCELEHRETTDNSCVEPATCELEHSGVEHTTCELEHRSPFGTAPSVKNSICDVNILSTKHI